MTSLGAFFGRSESNGTGAGCCSPSSWLHSAKRASCSRSSGSRKSGSHAFKPGFQFWLELNFVAWNLVVMPIAAP